MRDISSTKDFEKVTVSAKVVRMKDPVKDSGGLTKQDVILAWEADVGSTTEGTSHHFNNIVVRSYQDVKYISLPKDGVNMVEIEDIGDVAEDNLSEYSITVHSAEVIGVLTLESYAACLVCKAKVGPTTGKPGSLHQV